MDREARDNTIIRGLLEQIDDSAEIDQRTLAKELDIALGMANAYVRRCVKKGWVKVRQVPARRYRYYLTPKGFAEKARLTAEYFGDSLKFFRRARHSFEALYRALEQAGCRRIVLCGADELTEIAILCAHSNHIKVVAVWRGDGRDEAVGGVPSCDTVTPPVADRWVIASATAGEQVYRQACLLVDPARVTIPSILQSVISAPRANAAGEETGP